MESKKTSFSLSGTAFHIVSFFLALAIVFASVMLVAGVTLFNDKDLIDRVSGTTYFSELNNEIVTRCKTVAAKGGVDYEAVEGVISSSRIDADFTIYFNSVSAKDPHAGQKTIDEDALAAELYSAIVKYDPDITDSEKVNAEIIANKMAYEYKSSMVVRNFEEYIGYFSISKTVSRYIFFILMALIAYLIAAMFSLNGKKQKHRLFRRFAIVSGSAGLTVLVCSLLTKFSGILGKISFASTLREYNLFMSFFDDFLTFVIASGVLWILIGVALLTSWYLSVTGRIGK